MKEPRPWPPVLAAIFGGIAIAIVQNKVIPCLEVLQTSFQMDLTSFGWLSSSFCVMGIAMAFPAALIAGWLGLRRTCLLSLGCTLMGSLLGLWADSAPLLMVSRVIEGIGAGMISIAVPTLIAVWFPPEKRGLPTGLWSSWQFVAQALCFFFGVALTRAFGWKGVWVVGGGLTALAALACLLWLDTPPAARTPEEADRGPASVWAGLKVPSVWLVSGAMFCFCFSCFGFVNWAAACWNQQFGISLELANRYVSLFALISLPVVVLMGMLMDRVPRKVFAILISLGYIFAVGMAFLLPEPRWILPFVVLYPVFEGGVSTCLWTIIPQTVKEPSQVPSAVALFTCFSNVGMLLGPPAVGAVVERVGLWPAGALPVALSMAAAVFLLLPSRLHFSGQ